MTATDQDALVWGLIDDRAGNRSQVEGVLAAIGLPATRKDVSYGPMAALPNALLGASCVGVTPTTRATLQSPWPRLVVAAGRRTAPVARWIKKQGGTGVHLVQVMDPGAGRGDFDLICRPLHDAADKHGDNVFEIAAAPHALTSEVLVAGKEGVDALDGVLERPRIAVLVGGSTKRRKFTDAMAFDLCRRAEDAALSLGGSLLVTTSRRTGAAVETIAATLSCPHVLYRWDKPEGENPYRAYLAAADAIVITGESVSMCSEACALGKPVYIFAPPGLIGAKHARLHVSLITGGHAKLFTGDIDLMWSPKKLDVAGRIAAEIRQRGLI